MSENQIGPNDVLCGRGGATNNHVGNMLFRKNVSLYQKRYLESRKKEKTLIANLIVQMVHNSGGRFLKRDDVTNCWLEVPIKKALEKSSQALREGLDVRNQKVRTSKLSNRGSNKKSVQEGGGTKRTQPRAVSGRVVPPPTMGNPVREAAQAIPELKDETGGLSGHYLVSPPLLHIY